MRTTTLVHSPEERLRLRLMGDRRARMHQVQLWCAVSLLRTAITVVLPLCGSAGWWLAPVCLLPGLVMYGLACLALRRTGAATLTEAARCLLGRVGAILLSMLLALLFLMDGAASMTALVTGFTEGIGTEGTQITMALLTLLVMLFCLHRDGLAWGIHLMRWPMLALAAGAGAVMLTMARADGLHPVLGLGGGALTAAIRAGIAMGWPPVLEGVIALKKNSVKEYFIHFHTDIRSPIASNKMRTQCPPQKTYRSIATTAAPSGRSFAEWIVERMTRTSHLRKIKTSVAPIRSASTRICTQNRFLDVKAAFPSTQ